MGDKTKIEWCDATWSPIVGCTRVSEGCRFCYSERFMARFSGVPGHKFEGISNFTPAGPHWSGIVRLSEKDLDQPLHWRKPKRIFVNSISDTFHEKVPDTWLHKIFNAMIVANHHTYMILTKRPERMLEVTQQFFDGKDREYIQQGVPKHIWLGVSCEDQKTADERIPLLLQTPAAVRFISYEPALGPLSIRQWLHREEMVEQFPKQAIQRISWVICGGESGPGSRLFDIQWARDLRDQCKAAGTPYFLKQLGTNPYDLKKFCLMLKANIITGTCMKLKARKGGDWSEWPEDLRIREFPKVLPPDGAAPGAPDCPLPA